MQKQYQERTTLRTWEPWRTQERDAEWSAPTIAHHIHGASEPLGTTVAQRYDVPWDWLWGACHMAGVRWGSHRKRFCSKDGPHYCFEQSARNPTINLICKFGNPLGIPHLSCTAKLSGAYAMQESVNSRIFVSKKGMICIRPVDICTRSLRQKVERGKITGSESTTRFPRASWFEKPTRSVPEIWGCIYDVLAWSAQGTRKQDKKLDSCAVKKRRKDISK